MNSGSGSERLTLAESFNCMRDCQTDQGEWRDDVRRARGCTLGPPYAPHVERKPTAKQLLTPAFGSPYRGRYPDRSVRTIFGHPVSQTGHNGISIERLPEDPADGCPGAWYRTPLIDCVDAYARRRTRDGGRVTNPRFDAADWLIQEAVLYLEDEEERAIAYAEKVQADRIEALRKIEEAKHGHRR